MDSQSRPMYSVTSLHVWSQLKDAQNVYTQIFETGRAYESPFNECSQNQCSSTNYCIVQVK